MDKDADLVKVVSAGEDAYFTGLLLHLLEAHGFHAVLVPEGWSAEETAGGGASATALLAVLSRHSARDERLEDVLNRLREQHREAPVIFLRLEDAALPGGVPSAGTLDFHRSMQESFQRLFELLGVRFLAPEALGRDKRRAQERRQGDRRVSSVKQRLRKGFWLAHHRGTGAGEFDALPLGASNLERVRDHLLTEAQRYELTDPRNGREVNPVEAVDIAMRQVRKKMERPQAGAVYFVEAVAEALWERYLVEPRDRRRRGERRKPEPPDSKAVSA